MARKLHSHTCPACGMKVQCSDRWCGRAAKYCEKHRVIGGVLGDPQSSGTPAYSLGPAIVKTETVNTLKPVLPTDADERNKLPMADGLLDYFPLALAEVSKVSFVGNQQHNPGEPMHWARMKSRDHANKIMKHLVDRGTLDTDGMRHSAKIAWRALALLQEEMEQATGAPAGRASKF